VTWRLAACPFHCDGNPVVEVDDEEFEIARVICSECGSCGPFVDLSDFPDVEAAKAAAAERWNDRQ
jgi:MinD superfamily P-loop ATPase